MKMRIIQFDGHAIKWDVCSTDSLLRRSDLPVHKFMQLHANPRSQSSSILHV